MDNLLSSIKCVVWFSLGLLVWYALWVLHDVRSTVQVTRNTAVQVQQLSERINRFVTVERLRNLENGINTQIYATQTLTNSYKQIADVTTATLEKVINPRVRILTDNTVQIQEQTLRTLSAIERLTLQQNDNLTAISNATITLLENTNHAVVVTEPQALDILKQLANTVQDLRIITNDPSLQANLHQMLESTAQTSKNVQVITKELADLSEYVVEPIVRPKQQKGIKKLFTYVVRVVRVLSTAGNILFLLQRVP